MFNPLAFTTYERFLLSQFHINTVGLFNLQSNYLIYCPEVDPTTLANDGTNIHHWLQQNKIIGVNILIANEIPEGFIKVDEQLETIISTATGHLITQSDFENEVELLIPNKYPDYNISWRHGTIVISFVEPVAENDVERLKLIFTNAKFQTNIVFDPTVAQKTTQEDISFFKTISSFNKIKSQLSGNLRAAWENDEDTWLETRKSILSKPTIEKGEFQPNSFKDKKLRGLIDCSLHPPDNIRNQLTMYEQVCLIAPMKDYQEAALQNLGLTTDELIELVRLNKIQFIAPKSIEEYDLTLLSKLIEANVNNVHLSRSVTSMTLNELRFRNPLFFPPLPTKEKQVLLSSIDQSISSISNDTKIQDILRTVISDLGHGWVSIPNAVNQHDSIFLSQFGIVEQLSTVFQRYYNKDIKLGLMAAAPSVDLAAATGSILIPLETDSFSLAPYSEMIANLYSGVPSKDWIIQNPTYANFAVDEIFTIAQRASPIELATAFNGDEVSKFRKLILDISQHQTDLGEFQDTIDAYNFYVQQYEKNKDNLSTWNVRGFIFSAMAMPAGIPFGSWVLGNVFKQVLKLTQKSPYLDAIVKRFDAQIHGSIPDAVLISRMRDKIKKKF